MISEALHSYWPSLTIVGEESLHPKVPAHKLDLRNLDADLGPQPYLNEKAEELPIADSCVWVDPVDGTLSYTEGQLDEVSTLIGLSFRGKARLGVIGLPYMAAPEYRFSPRVFFGEAEHGTVYELGQEGRMAEYRRRKTPYHFTVTTSRIDSEEQCRRLRRVTDRVITSSGSGRKVARG